MKERINYSLKRLKLVFILELEQFQDPYYQGVAAQLAFYLFLSVVPIVILLSQMLGIFSLSLDEIQNLIDINGRSGMETIKGLLEYRPSGANSIFMAITAIWAASRAQFSLLRITNYTLSDGEFIGKSYIRDRIRAILTMMVVMLTLVLSLVVLVYLPIILKLIIGANKTFLAALKIWLLLRWPIMVILYFFIISYIYYVMPTKRVPFKDILPGSVFSSVGFLIVNFLYNKYTKFNATTDIMYGSMSNIVFLLFWFWFMAWVLCLGITLNRVWWATRRENAIPIGDEMKARRKPINIL